MENKLDIRGKQFPNVAAAMIGIKGSRWEHVIRVRGKIMATRTVELERLRNAGIPFEIVNAVDDHEPLSTDVGDILSALPLSRIREKKKTPETKRRQSPDTSRAIGRTLSLVVTGLIIVYACFRLFGSLPSNEITGPGTEELRTICSKYISYYPHERRYCIDILDMIAKQYRSAPAGKAAAELANRLHMYPEDSCLDQVRSVYGRCKH